jgi:hypothetical protein
MAVSVTHPPGADRGRPAGKDNALHGGFSFVLSTPSPPVTFGRTIRRDSSGSEGVSHAFQIVEWAAIRHRR